MSAETELNGPPETGLSSAASDGPFAIPDDARVAAAAPRAISEAPRVAAVTEVALTLADLPVGAHLILRCRRDWRDATIIAVGLAEATLSVGSPTGRTYRLRRPLDSPLFFDGSIPVLGAGSWRVGLARYDTRW